jgi:hypothetical protein
VAARFCGVPPALPSWERLQQFKDDDHNGTMGVMKTEPRPSDREVLAGLVERVTYQNAENGFCGCGGLPEEIVQTLTRYGSPLKLHPLAIHPTPGRWEAA